MRRNTLLLTFIVASLMPITLYLIHGGFLGVLLGALIGGIFSALLVRYRFVKPINDTIHRLNRPHGFTPLNMSGDSQIFSLINAVNSIIMRFSRESLAFRELARRFQRFLDEIDACIITVGDDGRVNYVSSRCKDLLRVDPKEWVGKHFFRLENVLDLPFPHTNEGKRIVFSNLGHWLLITTRKMGTYVFHTLTDITELTELRKKLEITQRLTALSSMLSGLAHSLKTPIANAKLSAQLLEEEHPNEPHLKTILSELRKIEQTLNSMFTIYKIEGTPRCSKILQYLEKVMEEIGYYAENRGVKLHLDVEDDDIRGYISPSLFTEAIKDMVKNAVDACTSGGKVRVVVRKGKKHVRLLICDDGKGMDEEVQKRWREPFFSTKPDGTGLGTVLIERFMNTCGAKLRLRSKPNKGTIISLEIRRCSGDRKNTGGGR